MDYDVAMKWIDALLSGEYEQGKEALQFNGKYCCLGVLCEVAIKSGLDIDVRFQEYGVFYNGKSGALPTAVREWAGMMSNSGIYEVNNYDAFLTSDNDEHGLTFSQIADIIRWQAEYL